MRFRGYVAILAVLLVAVFVGGVSVTHAADFPSVMKVGHIAAMTGNWAWAGKWKTQATRMAADEINASGEFPFKLEIVVVDHASGDPKKASAGMRKLVDIHHIPYCISGFETVTLAAREIAEEQGIPVINPGGVAPVLLNKPYLHNTRPMGPQMAVPMLKFFVEKYNAKRIAMAYWAEEFGEGVRDATWYFAPTLGAEVVAEISHEPLITDYRSELARVKAKKPDVLCIWSIGNDTGYIRKQAKEMGMDIPMGTILGINPVMIEIAGEETLKGLYDASQYFNVKSELGLVKEFSENYHKRYNEWPEQLAANYYEAMLILRDSIRHVLAKGGNPFEGQQLEDAIQAIKVFPSLYGDGEMELKPDGSIVKPVAITQYQGGSAKDVVFIKEVTPPPNQPYPAHK
jgi:branched-chain amino acid transport system substrate-binding protein